MACNLPRSKAISWISFSMFFLCFFPPNCCKVHGSYILHGQVHWGSRALCHHQLLTSNISKTYASLAMCHEPKSTDRPRLGLQFGRLLGHGVARELHHLCYQLLGQICAIHGWLCLHGPGVSCQAISSPPWWELSWPMPWPLWLPTWKPPTPCCRPMWQHASISVARTGFKLGWKKWRFHDVSWNSNSEFPGVEHGTGGLFIVFEKIPDGWYWWLARMFGAAPRSLKWGACRLYWQVLRACAFVMAFAILCRYSWTSFLRYAWGMLMLNQFQDQPTGQEAVFYGDAGAVTVPAFGSSISLNCRTEVSRSGALPHPNCCRLQFWSSTTSTMGSCLIWVSVLGCWVSWRWSAGNL